MNRTELQQLADVRLEEARALLALGVPMPDGAYYLAGYAVECALKACISKRYAEHDWPEKQFVNDCHTHNIVTLMRLAELEDQRAREAAANADFAQNWGIVKDWNERARYARHALFKAQKMLDAITDSVNGVLPWIKARW